MSSLQTETKAVVDSPAPVVYNVLSDIRRHRRSILPARYSGLRVVEGGVGDGTVYTVQETTGSTVRTNRMRVTEPEPGRVLIETDEAAPATRITYTVTPEGKASVVRVQTQWTAGGGLTAPLTRFRERRARRRTDRQLLRTLAVHSRRTGG